MNIEELARAAQKAFTGYEHDGEWPKSDRNAIKWEAVATKLQGLVIEQAAKKCLEKHANGNYKHDTREECAFAIQDIESINE